MCLLIFLRILYNHIHLPSLNSSQIYVSSLISKLLGFLFFLSHWGSFSCPNPQGFGHPQEHGWPTRSDTLKENWLFLPRWLCATSSPHTWILSGFALHWSCAQCHTCWEFTRATALLSPESSSVTAAFGSSSPCLSLEWRPPWSTQDLGFHPHWENNYMHKYVCTHVHMCIYIICIYKYINIGKNKSIYA